jgi:hypothetical protein
MEAESALPEEDAIALECTIEAAESAGSTPAASAEAPPPTLLAAPAAEDAAAAESVTPAEADALPTEPKLWADEEDEFAALRKTVHRSYIFEERLAAATACKEEGNELLNQGEYQLGERPARRRARPPRLARVRPRG